MPQHGDYTGNLKSQLAKEYAEEQQRAANSMSLAQQAVVEASSEPISLMPSYEHLKPTELVTMAEGDEEVEVEVDSDDPDGLWEEKTFRCSDTVDGVTIGKDTQFDLKESQLYIVPRWVYTHLDEKGLVWH